MSTMALTVMMLLRMITPPDRHANLVLHVRMKGAILGSVDLAMQVSTVILINTKKWKQIFISESARICLVPVPHKCL